MSGAGWRHIDPQPFVPPHLDIKSNEAGQSRRDAYVSAKLEIRSGREHQQFSVQQETICFDLGLSIDGAPIVTNEYVAREADLSVLEDHFFDSAEDGKRKILIVHGLGGMGKTQLALGFVQRFQSRFSSVFFLEGTSTATISRSFSQILDRIWDSWPLSLSGRESRPSTKPTLPDDICQAVLRWFSISKNRNWLMIYDNVDPVPGEDGTEHTINIKDFVPAGTNGSIIVTTRSKSLSSQTGLGQTYELGKMNDLEATELLEKRIRPSFLPSYQDAVMSSSLTHGVNEALIDLLQTLEGLPLALAQAGAYINDTGIGIREFVNLYERSRADLFNNLPAAENRENDPKASIWTTWKVSLDVLEHCTFGDESKQRLYRNSANLLLLFGYLDSRDIWYDLLEGGLLDTDAPAWFREVVGSEQSFVQCINVLREYSFVTADRVKGTYSMHNLLHEYCLHEAVERKREDLLKLAISIIGYSCPSRYRSDMWKTQQRLLPHIDSLLGQLKGEAQIDVPGIDWRSLSPDLEPLASRLLVIQGIHSPPYFTIHPVAELAGVLTREHRAEEAVVLLKSAMDQLEQSLGRQHLMTTVLIRELAWAYSKAGVSDKAKPLADEAYERFKAVFGDGHRETLSSAIVVSAYESLMGNIPTRLKLDKDIYTTNLRVFGPDDACTINALSNLALSESVSGEHAEAEVHYREAYYRYEKLLGSEHHITLNCSANLAGQLQENKKYGDSEQYKLKVLRGYMMLFGPDGPATIVQATELADDYEALSKGDEAQKLLRDLVDAIREEAPRNTTSLADALDNLSMVYFRQGQKSKAKQCLLEAYQAIITPDRKNQRRYIDAKSFIGIHLHEVGEELLARELLESCLLARESLSDPTNQSFMLVILRTLADVSEALEDQKGLLSILDRLDSICMTAKNEDVYDIMCSLGNVALKCRRKLCMTEKVLETFVKAAEFFTARDGPASNGAAISNSQIANYWKDLKDLEKAKEYYSKLVEVLDKAEGPARTLAVDALCDLGGIEESEGNWESGELRIVKALKEYRKSPEGNDAPLTALQLGTIYLRRNRFSEAEELFKESIDTMDWSAKDHATLRNRAILSSHLGYIAREQGRLEDAITLWKEALPVFTGFDTKLVLYRLGPTLAILDRFDDSFESFLHLYKHLGADEDVMTSERDDAAMCLSTVCICKHDMKEARSWLSRINEDIQKPGDSNVRLVREARLGFFNLALEQIELQLSQVAEADAGSIQAHHGLPTDWELRLDQKNNWCLSLVDPDGVDVLKRVPPWESIRKLLPLPSSAVLGSEDSNSSGEDLGYAMKDDVEIICPDFLPGRSKELLEGGWRKILQDIPEDLREDLKFHQRQTGMAWTYIPRPSSKATQIPLFIAGAPVIIPVRTSYPLLGPVGCPPDPHPGRINSASSLTDDLIKDIFSTYDFAKGFFLLLNGMLQIMVNAKFDYDKALKRYPIEFGGLSVSYVPMSMVPTAESSRRPSSTVTTGLEDSTSSSSLGFLSRLSLRHSNTSTAPPFTLSTNDTLEARVHTIGVNRGRHQGRVGLRIQAEDKVFLTMSTHVINSAWNSGLVLSKLPFGRMLRGSTLESSWKDYVSVYAQNKLVGKVAESFDPDAKEYPDGYMHDLCLIEPTDLSNLAGVSSPVSDMGWLSEGGWNKLRQNPSSLEVLGEPDPTTSEEQTTYPVPSDLCIVGEGIVRQKHGRLHGPLSQAILAERNAYAGIMSRCVLYRVFPNFSNPLGYSGIALYCHGEREGDRGAGPAVVGFQSFYQPSDAIQHAEMNRAAFDVRMSEGSISFFGAFQVPDRVRKTHGIL